MNSLLFMSSFRCNSIFSLQFAHCGDRPQNILAQLLSLAHIKFYFRVSTFLNLFFKLDHVEFMHSDALDNECMTLYVATCPGCPHCPACMPSAHMCMSACPVPSWHGAVLTPEQLGLIHERVASYYTRS